MFSRLSSSSLPATLRLPCAHPHDFAGFCRRRKLHVEKSGNFADHSAIVSSNVICDWFRSFATEPVFFCARLADKKTKDEEMVDKVPMTQNGFDKLSEELRWRQQEERPRIIEAIAEARAHGDLSENAEYHAAKEAQSHNEGRVGELEDLIARAEVIDLTKMSGSKIKFGATVKLVDEDTEEEKTYQIVGDQEADVKQGRISISSPIARALIGKEVGDNIEVVAPGGSKAYEILAVNWG